MAFKREILYFQNGFQKAATISFYCIQYYEYDHSFFYSFATSWDFTYISFPYIRFYLSGSTGSSHFEIEFGKNSKTYACVLKKNLSHLAGLAHFSYEYAKFFKGVSNERWDPTQVSQPAWPGQLTSIWTTPKLFSNVHQFRDFIHKTCFLIDCSRFFTW